MSEFKDSLAYVIDTLAWIIIVICVAAAGIIIGIMIVQVMGWFGIVMLLFAGSVAWLLWRNE